MTKINRDYIIFLRKNTLQKYHEQILDIFEEESDLTFNKVHIFISHSMKKWKYFIVIIPYDPQSVAERNEGEIKEGNSEALPIKRVYCFISSCSFKTRKLQFA